jgi:hypothetical protein
MSSVDPFEDFELLSPILPQPAILDYLAWRHFVNEPAPIRPALITMAAYQAMSNAERSKYNEQRRMYHARFGPIVTPSLKAVHEDALETASVNYWAPPGARTGLVLDGYGTLGKSTIITHLGRRYEQTVRRKQNLVGEELPNGNLYVPVVYINLPSKLTLKAFNRRAVNYFNIPAPLSADEDWLSERIIRAASDCGTSLFIIDDVHFIKMGNRSGEAINNHLKWLANYISATFVYAGIDLKGTKLFSEGASREREATSQTKRRFKRFEISPFEDGSDEFLGLLAAFEQHLVLLKHEPGILTEKLAGYVYNRTNGFIGAISQLVRGGALRAILQGEERLSRPLLDKIILDYGAEEGRR